jgi:hypothetical protein
MTDNIPARRARLGFTRTRLATLAIVVLGSAGGAAAYAMRPSPAPQAAAESPSASAVPSPPSANPRPVDSASPRPPTLRPSTLTGGTKIPTQKKSHAPDSAVDPDSVFIDPAAAVASAAQWDASSPSTCARWRDLLSRDQQTSYATALLRMAWQNDGSSASPPGATVRSYRSAITAACLGKGKADDIVSDVARVVYAANPGKWVP